MEIPQDLNQWTAKHFRYESARIQQALDEANHEDTTPVLVGAMMLAALREGTNNLAKLAEVIDTTPDRLEPYFVNLTDNGVFTLDGVDCDWGDDEHGGIAFLGDLCVAMGLVNRSTDEAIDLSTH